MFIPSTPIPSVLRSFSTVESQSLNILMALSVLRFFYILHLCRIDLWMLPRLSQWRQKRGGISGGDNMVSFYYHLITFEIWLDKKCGLCWELSCNRGTTVYQNMWWALPSTGGGGYSTVCQNIWWVLPCYRGGYSTVYQSMWWALPCYKGGYSAVYHNIWWALPCYRGGYSTVYQNISWHRF